MLSALLVGVAAPAFSSTLRAQADSSAKARAVSRGRIIGVYDDDTGDPISGVEVLDLFTHNAALTTATGTVSLFYAPAGTVILELKKVGYTALTLTTVNSDSANPVTVVMKRGAAMLPTVTTRAMAHLGPADTVRRLDLSGYYDRREHSGAPFSAFTPGERIANMTTFDDFSALTGRAVCTTNLYIDGVQVKAFSIGQTNIPGRASMKARNLRSNPVDLLLDPHMVAGIENYRDGEVPAEFNATRANGSSCGATVIWTK